MPTFKLKPSAEDKLIATTASVKKGYGEKTKLVDYLNKKNNDKDEYILNVFWENKDCEKMWNYVLKFGVSMPYEGLSEVKPYTNKRGKTSMAHFNGSKYMKACIIKDGITDDKSIVCIKWEVPSKSTWYICEESGKFYKRRHRLRVKIL